MPRVLILEDDPLDAELIQYVLTTKEYCCQSVWTQTQSEFLAALQQSSFDVILADYTLPDFDGLLALAQAQTLCPDTPVVMLSAMMREELVVEALKGGVADYVSKLHLSRLPHVVQRVIREARERCARKQAEAALREKEEQLELFFSQSLDGCFFMLLEEPITWNETVDKERVLDYVFLHQHVTKANDAILKQYGATREQALGATPRQLRAHDLATGRSWYRRLFDAGYLQAESDDRRLDGTSFTTEGNYVCLYDAAGRITGFFGIQRDISERKQAEIDRKTLSRRLINSQEEERHRLARELHDEIGQVFTAVKLDLQAIQRDEPLLAERLEETCGIVTYALNQVRTLARDLRPPMLEHVGLVAALRWCVGEQAQRGHFRAQFTADPLPVRPSSEVEIACFRIGQEALTNVVRHAHAQQVRVELRQEEKEQFSLRICDDGIGFDVQTVQKQAATGITLGILGMQERVRLVGGQLTIRPTPHGGTEIWAQFPLQGGKET
jgi:two-component system sensor histidine kinase UhpB